MSEAVRSGRGGYRQGSGRPSQGERKLVTVRLHKEQYDRMVGRAKEQGVSQSKYIETLIDKDTE